MFSQQLHVMMTFMAMLCITGSFHFTLLIILNHFLAGWSCVKYSSQPKRGFDPTWISHISQVIMNCFYDARSSWFHIINNLCYNNLNIFQIWKEGLCLMFNKSLQYLYIQLLVFRSYDVSMWEVTVVAAVPWKK